MVAVHHLLHYLVGLTYWRHTDLSNKCSIVKSRRPNVNDANAKANEDKAILLIIRDVVHMSLEDDDLIGSMLRLETGNASLRKAKSTLNYTWAPLFSTKLVKSSK
ncbi:hypothetical protein Tco_1295437 [Tanacetum coccineum]